MPQREPKGLQRPLILLGPPGAGKGTQAKQVAQLYGVAHLSTGDMPRDYATRGTELGRRIQAIMNRGELIPDDVVVAMIENRIGEPDCAHGFILDGFPRNVAQAQVLDAMLGRKGWPEPVVINLRMDESRILRRLTGRRVCKVGGEIYNIYDYPPKSPGRCDRDGGELVQRDDDREEVIRKRMAAYRELTQPVAEHYRERSFFEEVDGLGCPESVTRDVLAAIEREENGVRHL